MTTAESQPRDDFRTGRRTALAGIVVSATLAVSNVVVGLLAHSTSLVATGVEFAGDVVASGIVLVGMIVAARPPDANHPYGHGRIEMLAGFVVGMIVLAGGVAICYGSLQRIGESHPPPGLAAVAALVFAIAARLVMSVVKFRIGRRIRSASLVADAWNDAVDILSATVALAAISLAMLDPVRFLAADHYGGFAVGIVVVVTGLRIARGTSLELVDTMPDEAAAADIRRVAAAVPGVEAIEKSYARKTGLQFHVDLHIQVDPRLTVTASHAIAGRVRAAVREALPWVADVLVHVEPAPPSAPPRGR